MDSGNVFGTNRTVAIAVKANGTGQVNVSGTDISNSVRGLRIDSQVNHPPRVELDLAISENLKFGADNAQVVMSPSTRDLLMDYGWRPPAAPASRMAELRGALVRLREAAELYLDTQPRSAAREAELRSALGNAAVDATFPLYGPCATCQGLSRETTGMVCQTCGRDYGRNDSPPQTTPDTETARIGTNSGHGHAWERPDGSKARCMGPAGCAECRRDEQLVAAVAGSRAYL